MRKFPGASRGSDLPAMKNRLLLSTLGALSIVAPSVMTPSISARATENLPPPPTLTFTATVPVFSMPSHSIKVPPPKGPIHIPPITILRLPEVRREIPGYIYVALFCAVEAVFFGVVYYLFWTYDRRRMRLKLEREAYHE